MGVAPIWSWWSASLAVAAASGSPSLLGDFAFVLWDAGKRQVFAAGDALGVQRLYYSWSRGLLAFASRAEALATEGRYDLQYLAEILVLGMASHSLTPYAEVHALPSASTMTLVNGNLNVSSYWEPSDFPVDTSWEKAESAAIATCRELLTESVRQRMNGEGETWAQLSGGLDSSSVVCVAQWLATAGLSPGLAGTVTFVDRDGTRSDERVVLRRCGRPLAAKKRGHSRFSDVV